MIVALAQVASPLGEENVIFISSFHFISFQDASSRTTTGHHDQIRCKSLMTMDLSALASISYNFAWEYSKEHLWLHQARASL